MKKLLDKIVTITLAFSSLMFVALMYVVMFKPDYAQNLDNALVHVLIIVFSALFVVLTVINIYSAFSDNDRIKNILLFKGKSSAAKASISVVKRTAKNAVKDIEGVKLKKISLFANENNDVSMKIDVKAETEDVENLVIKLRATIVSALQDVLGVVFSAVDFRLVKVKNSYKPNSDKVDEKIAQYKKEIEEEKAAKAESEAKLMTESEKDAVESSIAIEDKASIEDEAVESVTSDDALADDPDAKEVVKKEVSPLEDAEEDDSEPSAEEVIEKEINPEK